MLGYIFRLIPSLTILLGYTALCQASMFSFHIVDTVKEFHSDQDTRCKCLGYEGLAVMKSPEAFARALEITQTLRQSAVGGLHIGLYYYPETSTFVWSDGSMIPSDVNFAGETPGSQALCAKLSSAGKHKFALCDDDMRYALCGDQSNMPSEAYGSSTLGQQATGVGSSLSVSASLSYLGCVLLCGQDYRCRLAEFHRDLLTCTILGPGQWTGFSPNSAVQTFVRNGY